MEMTGKGRSDLLTMLLTGLAVVLTLNALAIRYPFQVILPFVQAALLLLITYIYGFFILALLKKQAAGFPESVAAGMMFTAGYFYLVSFPGLLSPLAVWIYYLFPGILMIFIRRSFRPSFFLNIASFFKRPSVGYLFFLFPLIYASLPPSFYDSLVIHLGIPNFFIQNRGFIPAPQFLFANTSIYYELSLIPAVFAGEMVPRLFHFFIGVILICMTADFAADHYGLKNKNRLVLLILSLPVTALVMTAVKNDLISAFFILIGIRAMLKGKDAFASVFWGFAIGVKYTNVIPLILFMILLFIRRRGIRLRTLLLIGLILFLMVLPLMVKNYALTGNPAYPFFSGLFHSPEWDASRQAVMQKGSGGIFRTVKDFVQFPYNLSFRDIGGIAGPVFLIFLPFALVGKKREYFLLLFAVLLLLAGPYFKMSIRCWFIAFLIMSVYVMLIVEQGMPRVMRAIFFVVIGWNLFTSFALLERYYISNHLFSGKMDTEQYKSAVFPTYPAISFVNRNTGPKEKILIVGESRSFYLKRPYMVSSPYDYSILSRYLSAENSGEFRERLRSDGYSYVIFNRKEFDRLQKDYDRLAPRQIGKMNMLLGSLVPVFSENGVMVLQI